MIRPIHFLSIYAICAFVTLNTLRLANLLPSFHYSLARRLNPFKRLRGYNILALGGSTTWGAALSNRKHAYPFLMEVASNRVANFAIQNSGSDYPSRCTETMVGDEEIYDVILLEFTHDGDDGLEDLLKRLRTRFPDAIIVYIHLYELEGEAVNKDGLSPLELDKRDAKEGWSWNRKKKRQNDDLQKYMKELLKSVGGHVYALPRPEKPKDAIKLFSPDWHHLSQWGHQVIANAVMDMVDELTFSWSYLIKKPRLGSWGEGDQCDGWKGYNILTLGGSVTWGAKLQEKLDTAYPYLVGASPNRVDNMALRASGADYPSMCLQSMIGEETYDVIVLEFTLNGGEGLQRLLERLRRRFPHAVIIYVHLYSLKIESELKSESESNSESNSISNSGQMHHSDQSAKHHRHLRGSQQQHDLDNLSWGEYKRRNDDLYLQYDQLLKSVKGYIYKLPRPSHPKDAIDLFGEDWHHLSPKGHQAVANGINDILYNVAAVRDRPVEPTPPRPWAREGDQCHNWFESGETSLTYDNAKMNQLSWDKYALEFETGGVGTLQVDNSELDDVPVYVSYMTRDHHYPITKVRIGEDQAKTTIDPNIDAQFHVTKTKQVGVAKPGENVISFRPIPGAAADQPFRLTNVILCGHCTEERGKQEEVKKET